MILHGKLFVESPIYRGNARKTLFTRDGDGKQRLVSLAGEIAGTAQSLMDAFVGKSRNGKNIGLMNELWFRLFESPLSDRLIQKVECKLNKENYPRDHFFDLRMGIKLDEDRWAAEANANYKMETLFRDSVFDMTIYVQDAILKQQDNEARLYYILNELRDGRFWFGAGKSKGLGKCRLEMDLPFSAPADVPNVNKNANHLSISLRFDSTNPILVGWNWGKVDPEIPAFAAIEGRLLVEAMRNLPDSIRERLALAIGGPILSPKDWKNRLKDYLPRSIAILLRENSIKEGEVLVLPQSALKKMQKGKFPLSKKIIERLVPLCDKPFSTKETAEKEIAQIMGKKANLIKRVMPNLETQSKSTKQFDNQTWLEVVNSLGLDSALAAQLEAVIADESALVKILTPACGEIMPRLYDQVDRQVKLLQSDAWIDLEIANREAHAKIKSMLINREISEAQWESPNYVPEGMKPAAWREFLESHKRVGFRYMTNDQNLRKSITNDQNHIAFLNTYRDRTRQELAQPFNTDFRAGGFSNREISKKYGKPYDTIFMRMLTWKPSAKEGTWEVYIPGSTIKGAFRKRASMVLKTLWGDSSKTGNVLDRLFGKQGMRGLIFFSDAQLADPNVPENSWCSMDGVKMDPMTAQPIEEAKSDYLFAYGENLIFNCHLDLQDVRERDMIALSVFSHLLMDFNKGDIPLGSEKSNGFGWAKADITKLKWMSTHENGFAVKLFGEQNFDTDGLWHTFSLAGDDAMAALRSLDPINSDSNDNFKTAPKANSGFISHRSFGGYCGTLKVEGEVLTPLSIQESGEPSFSVMQGNEPINGWDFFSIAPPAASQRGSNRVYALPSKSIRGMLRHIYAIASDSKTPSPDISHLNPADSLFGWVGSGQNQAIMGRISINFATFENPELSWFKVPYPYGNWQFIEGEWKCIKKERVHIFRIDEAWRLFPHAPLAPIVEKVDDFKPDTVQASYMRAILPGARCRFDIRFWNLEKEELERLVWSLMLEKGLAHKMGKSRYVGFGSIKLKISEDSYLIRWEDRYSGKPEETWRLALKPEEWINTANIKYYDKLREALDANPV